MNSFFLNCQLPPNTEGSAEPREAIGASLRTQVRTSWQNKTPLPSFLSGGQNKNDDRRKEYNMTFSEESGSG